MNTSTGTRRSAGSTLTRSGTSTDSARARYGTAASARSASDASSLTGAASRSGSVLLSSRDIAGVGGPDQPVPPLAQHPSQQEYPYRPDPSAQRAAAHQARHASPHGPRRAATGPRRRRARPRWRLLPARLVLVGTHPRQRGAPRLSPAPAGSCPRLPRRRGRAPPAPDRGTPRPQLAELGSAPGERDGPAIWAQQSGEPGPASPVARPRTQESPRSRVFRASFSVRSSRPRRGLLPTLPLIPAPIPICHPGRPRPNNSDANGAARIQVSRGAAARTGPE